jgi:pSer/pThr/pTyr-binding forkhead associated (FHA) protein/S1-C subfamily serine protease
MRTLSIGRSSSNNIVVADPTVSSQHASLSISSGGEVKIKDLNSKNGTFVNGIRITRETLLTPNDVVKTGNSILNWQKYLHAPKAQNPIPFAGVDLAGVQQKKTIGRNGENDIVLAYNDVSGSHAQLLKKENGDIVLVDTGSTNGTYVNGHKISMQTLRSGDTVLLANKYPLAWDTIYPRPVSFEQSVPSKTKPAKALFIAAAGIAAAAVVVIGILFFPRPWSSEKIYAVYKNSVVMIYGAYNYAINVNGQHIGNYIIDNSGRPVEDEVYEYTGTGFVISRDGRIVTNQHVAAPWVYEEEAEQLKRLASQSFSGNIQVTGQLAYIGFMLNDTYVNSLQDLIECAPQSIKTGASPELDVAIIQTTTKTLPAGITTIVDLNNAALAAKDLAVGTEVYTIGFPAGFVIGSSAQGITSTAQEGKISQERGDIEFGLSATIIGGASGSPVFNQQGKLVGVVNAVFTAADGYSLAIKAKHILDLVK